AQLVGAAPEELGVAALVGSVALEVLAQVRIGDAPRGRGDVLAAVALRASEALQRAQLANGIRPRRARATALGRKDCEGEHARSGGARLGGVARLRRTGFRLSRGSPSEPG